MGVKQALVKLSEFKFSVYISYQPIGWVSTTYTFTEIQYKVKK